MTFRQCVSAQFNKTPSNKKTSSNPDKGKGKQADISRVPPPIPLRLSKSVLAKSNFFKKNIPVDSNSQDNKQSYAQASKSNIMEIFKIKDAFPKLSLDKVSEIHNAMSKSSQKGKLKINMMTQGPSRKQIIILMGSNNVERVMAQSNIANINRRFKDIKSETSVDFMCSDNKGIVVTTTR